MKVFGVIGWKHAGKTTLVERLLAEISARGFSVSSIKHSHHDIDLDTPGSDSFRHRAAGASEVILASPNRFALLHDHHGEAPGLAALLTRLAPVDLVLVEGFKHGDHPKVEVFRALAGHDLIQPADATVRAVASDSTLPALTVPCLNLNDAAEVADFILKDCGLVAV